MDELEAKIRAEVTGEDPRLNTEENED